MNTPTSKTCPNCNNPLNNPKNTYCSQKCAAIYTQRDGGHCQWSDDNKKRLSDWAKSTNAIRHVRANHPKVKKISKRCLFCTKEFLVNPNKWDSKKKYCSRECTISHSRTGILKGKSGGYRLGAGRGKHGWYKGFHCDSSWELAWVIYQLEHGVQFQRNTTKFPYTFDGKSYSYIPDFILPNNEYVEIKGWPNEKTKSKISQFPHKLTILWKPDMENIIDYVKKTYGKDFIKLYEGNPHNQKKNKCGVCGNPSKHFYCSRQCSGKAANIRNYGVGEGI